jgi:hypothetical protein
VACFETILAQADLVKFAERVPETSAIDSLGRTIAGLIEKYKRRRRSESEANRVQTGR